VEAEAIATPIKTLEEIRREREVVNWSLGDDPAPEPRKFGALLCVPNSSALLCFRQPTAGRVWGGEGCSTARGGR
jgi:hypothetical protein